jgi:hypothetical protein
MSKVAIAIVVFNISSLISIQVEFIKRFCTDNNFDIIITDNSNNTTEASLIKTHADNLGLRYFKTSFGEDFSQSHAAACNYSYKALKDLYDYIFFLDHDNFPIKNFSVKDILNDKIIGGVGLIRPPDKYYFWPGCVMFNQKIIEKNLVDFSVNYNFGLDTGGNLYQIIDKYGLDNCVFFNKKEVVNDTFNWYKTSYDVIYNKESDPLFCFMHFRSSSNWNKADRNDERINSLLVILNNKANE